MAYEWQEKQKQSTRQSILRAASRLLFRKGIQGTSVAGLMKEAGLTAGGFYAHFSSKDELVLESFRSMLQATAEKLKLLPGTGQEKIRGFREFYLSRKHRDEPESGCPVLPLLFEAAGKSDSFRRRFASELEIGLKERLQLLGKSESPEALEQLLGEFSTLLGAQLLARAVKGVELSDKILAAAAKALDTE